MPDYTYIQKQHQLDLALTQLAGAKIIAVDTESSGYYTYFSELCLIQLSADGYHFVIDVLGGMKLDKLGALFADKNITKIFHGAQSDILEMRRAYNWDFNNVFDTLPVCRMLGHKSCSLLALVKTYCGVELKKKEQKSNWKKRPLTRSQLDYANLDTVYLEEVMDKMLAELQNSEILEELHQEFVLITNQPVLPEKPLDENNWMRLPEALNLKPEQRAYLKRLYLIRENRARKDNIASFRLITNDGLLRIVARRPEQLGVLHDMKVANPVFIKKEGEQILAAAHNLTPINDSDLPLREEIDPKARDLLKDLKKWRQRIADFRRVETSLILNNRALTKIAETRPTTLDELEELELMSAWKFKYYGPALLSVVAGKYNGDIPENLPRVENTRYSEEKGSEAKK